MSRALPQSKRDDLEIASEEVLLHCVHDLGQPEVGHRLELAWAARDGKEGPERTQAVGQLRLEHGQIAADLDARDGVLVGDVLEGQVDSALEGEELHVALGERHGFLAVRARAGERGVEHVALAHVQGVVREGDLRPALRANVVLHGAGVERDTEYLRRVSVVQECSKQTPSLRTLTSTSAQLCTCMSLFDVSKRPPVSDSETTSLFAVSSYTPSSVGRSTGSFRSRAPPAPLQDRKIACQYTLVLLLLLSTPNSLELMMVFVSVMSSICTARRR